MLRGKRRYTALVLLLSVFLVLNTNNHVAAQKPASLSTEQQLKSLYEKLLVASKTKDEATLRQILTENYSQATADGRVRTKAIRLQETMSTEGVTEILSLESFEVFVYRDSAVARCRVRQKGSFRGETYDQNILSTATFVKEGNVWRIAATHLSLIKT